MEHPGTMSVFSMTKPSNFTNGKSESPEGRLHAIYAKIGLGACMELFQASALLAGELMQKKVLLVDDSAWAFEFYAEPLMSATGGNAYFLLHEGLKLNQLCEKIIGIAPEYVLMDANLDGGLSGIDVTAELRRRAPGIKVIGFSNSISYASAFTQAGAIGAVRKRSDDVTRTMGELGEVIASVN